MLRRLRHAARQRSINCSSDSAHRRGACGFWSEFSRSAKYLDQFELDDGYDWYVTRNGFCSRKERGNGSCRQLNSFLFDIDFHDRETAIQDAVTHALSVLEGSWLRGALPEPTMVVSTGRGLHLYYALDRSTSTQKRDASPNDRGVRFFHDIERRLCQSLERELSSVPKAKVDRAVFDPARVSRIPGTINTHTGTICQVVRHSGRYHSLSSLSSALPGLKSSSRRKGRGGRVFKPLCAATQLASSRLAKIASLQKLRGYDNEGNRELMCFCYYNAAVQNFTSREDAFEELVEFNARFKSPIPVDELNGIRASVDKVGFYKLSSSKITAFLDLSEEEASSTGFFLTKRDIMRQEAKTRTASKRQTRNESIFFLNNISGLSKASISKLLNCSLSTVYSVLSSRNTAPDGISLKQATRLLLDSKDYVQCFTTDNTADKNLEPRPSVEGGHRLMASLVWVDPHAQDP